MKTCLLYFFPLLLLLSTGCQSGGGKKRYEYPASKLGSQHQVKSPSLDGRFLILDDGSMWNIDWGDSKKARRWSTGDRVSVISTHGKSFPYALIKQSSGERIAARYGKKL